MCRFVEGFCSRLIFFCRRLACCCWELGTEFWIHEFIKFKYFYIFNVKYKKKYHKIHILHFIFYCWLVDGLLNSFSMLNQKLLRVRVDLNMTPQLPCIDSFHFNNNNNVLFLILLLNFFHLKDHEEGFYDTKLRRFREFLVNSQQSMPSALHSSSFRKLIIGLFDSQTTRQHL